MNGFRTLVLQDLSHILPPRGRQLHATASSRRFWNFFEFSLKEDASCRGPKKCASSKDISSSLISNELENVSTNACSSASRAISPNLNPKIHAYNFDLKPNSVGSPKPPSPLTQPDNLVSLLDGNPVPNTMKWKLKGYKTLRNEESSDFAFVPGGNTYDLDILTRNKYGNCPKPKDDDTGNRDTLCLTTRGIESKPNVVESGKSVKPDVEAAKSELGTSGSSNEQNGATAETLETVCEQTPGKITGGVTTGVTKKEDQFLSIAKSESVASNLQCQSQPKVQYSSKPPKSISKPLPPGRNKDEQFMDDSSGYIDKPMTAPSAESYRQVSKSHVPTEQAESRVPRQAEGPGHVDSEWSSMEQQRLHVTEQKVADSTEANYNEEQIETSRLPSNSRAPEKEIEEPSAPVAKSKYYGQWCYSKSNLSPNVDGKSAYDSVLSVLPKHNPLNISSPHENQPVKTSPCAATQARLQQAGPSKELQSGYQSEPQGQTGSSGFGGSTMGGSGGSRKPPAFYPPITMKRSSSNAPYLTKNAPEKEPRKSVNKNSSSNLSTSTAELAPRKCEDQGEMEEGRTVCTKPRQRKCGKQRKCKKDTKKSCKRYCCPALQVSTECDYSKYSKGKEGKKSRPERDPTCLPNEEENKLEGGREICTTPRRRDQSCKRERSCNRERSRRSCNREESCPRNRNRSCKRQERRECSQEREEQSREICTKPRKRDTCNRQKCGERDCGRRSAKCTGRRNFTHSAFTGRRKPTSNMRRYSSLPAFAFSLIGMKSSGETKQNLLGNPVNGRFYGKKPPPCKPPKSDDKCEKPASSTDVKCKAPPAKCKPPKKTESVCKPPKKTESICKPPKKTESICKPPKKTESICKPPKKTEDKCKPPKKTDDICKPPKKAEPKCKPPPKCGARKSETTCKPPKKTESICKPPKKTDNICMPPKKTESICKPPKKTESICKPPKKTESICKPPKKTESICKPPKKTESICKPPKKTESICKPPKKTESICKPPKKTESICKPPKKTENVCKPPKKTESKCKVTSKKSDPCKARSKSDDYCAKKREEMCKERKCAQPSSSQQGESLKERVEREKKEMEECKKHIKPSKKEKDKKKEEKVAKGLERVVSPCKQKPSGKCGKDPSKKMSCIGVPFDCLVSNTVGNVITMSDNKAFSILPDRNYSVMRSTSNFEQLEPGDTKSDENIFWNNYDDDFGTDAVPVPIETEIEDEKFNDTSYSNTSWFLSWFNNDHY